MNYKEKIRKLLALAESPAEHEAKAALLKARKLMAEHKLSEDDINAVENQSVRKVVTDITCSKRRNPWIIDLSAIIGEHYCCKAFRRNEWRKQTMNVGFVGLEDDVEICAEIFKYAVDCCLAEAKRLKYQYVYQTLLQSDITRLRNGVGYGFAAGLSAAFEKQQEENREWGLVLQIPSEVREATQDFAKADFKPKAKNEFSALAYTEGYAAGKKFDPSTKLNGGTEE